MSEKMLYEEGDEKYLLGKKSGYSNGLYWGFGITIPIVYVVNLYITASLIDGSTPSYMFLLIPLALYLFLGSAQITHQRRSQLEVQREVGNYNIKRHGSKVMFISSFPYAFVSAFILPVILIIFNVIPSDINIAYIATHILMILFYVIGFWIIGMNSKSKKFKIEV